jgi:hypothetical protein
MKITIIVFVLLIVAAGLFWPSSDVQVISDSLSPQNVAMPTESTPLIDTRALDKATNNIYVGRQAQPMAELSVAELAQLKTQAAIKQTEIEDLMLEFDQVLTDTNARALVKAKINLLKEEYNQLVLPIMMHEMKKRSG